MNGLGNEIVVVDLRGIVKRLRREAEARAIAGRPALALRPAHGAARPRDCRAPRPTCASTIPTARRPRPAATACAASAGSVAQETGAQGLNVRDRGRRPGRGRRRHRPHHGRHGRAAVRLAGHSAGRALPRHAHDRAADRPDRQADPAFALGGQRRQSACGVLGRRRATPSTSPASARCWRTIRCFPSAPTSRWPRVTSPDAITRAHLGARRRPDQGLRQRRLRGDRVRGAQGPDRPQGRRRRCPAAPRDRVARRRPHLDDRARSSSSTRTSRARRRGLASRPLRAT